MVWALAVTAVLGAVQPELQPGPAEAPRNVVFLQPLISIVGGAAFQALGLSFGGQYRLDDEWSLTADAATLIFAQAGMSEDRRFVNAASAAFGVTRQLMGRGLTGLFVTPKIYTVVARSAIDVGPSPVRGGGDGFTEWNTFELGLAGDIALQWTMGRFFIGTVLGIGVGYAIGGGVLPFSTFSSTLFTFDTGGGPVVALNLHLLRIGYAW